jgi:hypothetical protein
MRLEERERRLLTLVDEYLERESHEILDGARRESAELVRRAYRSARQRLRERVVAERSRALARVQAARAERVTRERRASEQTSVDLLAAAWPLLRARLLASWGDPERRRRWATHYLREALRVLPRGQWTVRHAPDWAPEEQQAAVAELGDALPQPPRFRSDGGITTGLVIESGGAMLDASLEGLLRDRARLEARLLALIEAELAP